MYHSLRKQTQTGENITLNNTTGYIDTKISGNSVQKTRSGKNLFDNNNINDLYGDAVRISKSDTGMRITTLSSHATSSSMFRVLSLGKTSDFLGKIVRISTKAIPSASYEYSRMILGTASNDGNNRSAFNNTAISGDVGKSTQLNITYTVPNEIGDMYENLVLWLYCNTKTADKANDYIDYTDLIVTVDNEDMTYEPYGASPSPEFPAEICNVGDNVNIFDSEDWYNTLSKINSNDIQKEVVDGIEYYKFRPNAIYSYEYMKGKFKENTQYTISCMARQYNQISKNGTGFYFYYTDGSKEYKNIPLTLTDENFHLTSKPGKTLDCIRLTYNYNFYALVRNIKLEEGSVATPYSKYGEGCTSIKISNKNLLSSDFNQTEISEAYRIQIFGKTGQYIMSIIDNNKNIDLAGIYFGFARNINNKNEAILWYVQNGKPIDSYNFFNRKGMNAFIIYPTTEETYNKIFQRYNIQIEENTTVTDYQPHEEQNFIMPLKQPMHKGDYLAEDGIHHVRKTIELKGNENISVEGNTESTVRFVVNSVGNSNNSAFGGLCSHFNYRNNYNVDEEHAYVHENGNAYIFINKSRGVLTVEQFENYLKSQKEAGTPVTIEYELATEEIEPYNEEQQKVYDEIRQAKAYKEVTHIFSDDTIPPVLEVSAYEELNKDFKNRVVNGKITRAYLKVLKTETKPEMIIDESNYLKDLVLEDLRYVPEQGFIGQAVAKRVTGNFNNVEEDFSIQDREFELYMGVDLEDGTTEYIKYGTYVVQKPTDDQVTDNTSFEALDYMCKLNQSYVDDLVYPCTLGDVWKDLVEQSGLKTKTFTFPNDDFIVDSNQFEVGTTQRDVAKAIAAMAFNWVRVNEDDELVMDFEQKEETDEELTIDQYYDLSSQEKYGPVNTIVLRNSQVEGENVTIKDEESINSPGGKNLADISKIEIGKTWNNTQNNTRSMLFINVKPNTDYSISFNDIGTKRWSVNELNKIGDTTFISQTAWKNDKIYNIKTNLKTNVIGIHFIADASGTTIMTKDMFDNDKIQLEEGTEPTEYEPFMPLGQNELVIADNPFAYTQEKRTQLIEAGKRLYGLTYTPMSMNMIGFMHLNCQDKISTNTLKENSLNTYLFNHTIEYNGTVSDSMESKALTKTETKYQFTPDMIKKQLHTEIVVDKNKGEIEARVLTVEGLTKQNKTQINNNYQDIIGRFNDVATTNDIAELNTQVSAVVSTAGAALTLSQDLQVNGVSKVKTEKGFTFDNEGLTIDETNAKTKSNLDTDGLTILDKTGSSDEVLLEAGYNDDTGETIVKSKNITVEKYLTIGTHSRIEDYQEGTGIFWIGD